MKVKNIGLSGKITLYLFIVMIIVNAIAIIIVGETARTRVGQVSEYTCLC